MLLVLAMWMSLVCNHLFKKFDDTGREGYGVKGFQFASSFSTLQKGNDDGIFPNLWAIGQVERAVENIQQCLQGSVSQSFQKKKRLNVQLLL